tara:strand:+ start:695 stop:997 length:303 start_codon:yes stop_codon:yes gene_type:complete
MANNDSESNIELPSVNIWKNLARISISEDKPIMLDYWIDSLSKDVSIGVKTETNEKMLVKSAEEYTSPISKIFKIDDCYIICTENSIYLTKNTIPTKKIV